ncbi:uncharacterized protein ACA1_376930 [Acanthamoeba castellanii str. Neff]|uniref:PAS domain-containing protein n=1 Tax=Acanthamoeba castellanii (strain ATCC 30010 / Neff) TaxID=1257118 RepID=L8HHN0_ACACF|nr:uncharacterized protein ACA1_376930 [Acanthamoeba castellanii str. Neff]ELR24208.1 hypothetical protein ACA1_376930 [Acanthamoeba castellanii str. Neff]
MGQLLVLLLAELNEVKRSSREIGNTVESLKRKRDQLDHKLEVMQRTQASQLRHLALAQQRSMHQLESMLAQLAPSQLTLLQDGPMPHAPLPMPQPMPLPMPPPMLTFPPPPLPYSQGMGSVVRRNNSFPASVLQVLPFLPSYDFSKEPCVIEDLGQMLVVASLNEPECFDDIEPSMVFYASPSLCSLLGYQQGELIGRSTADICEGTFDVMVSILAHLLCGSPTPVGSRYTIEGRYLAKAPGQPFNVRSRHQTLYGPSGTAQWMLSVIEEVLPPDPTLPPAVPYSHLLSDPLPCELGMTSVLAIVIIMISTITVSHCIVVVATRLPHPLLFLCFLSCFFLLFKSTHSVLVKNWSKNLDPKTKR